MTTIAQQARRLKQRLPEVIGTGLVQSLMEKLPRVFRERILTPAIVVQLLVLRILEGNTAYAHLPHLAHMAFTASAFCQALARLPLELDVLPKNGKLARSESFALNLEGEALCHQRTDPPGDSNPRRRPRERSLQYSRESDCRGPQRTGSGKEPSCHRRAFERWKPP